MLNCLEGRHAQKYCRKFTSISILICLTFCCAVATAEKNTKTDPRIQSALAASEVLDVELAADLLLAMIKSDRIPKDVKISHLEKLYWRAGEARKPYPGDVVPRYAKASKGEEFAAAMSAIGVNSLDIRLRTLDRLANLDRSALRGMEAATLERSPPTDASCDQAEVPIVGDQYYPTLFRTYPNDVDDVISRLSTPQEAAALLKFISAGDSAASLGTPRLSHAIASVVRVLDASKVSSAVFVLGERRLNLGANLEELLSGPNVPPGLQIPLARAWCAYLDRHLRDQRCGDSQDTPDLGSVKNDDLPRAHRLAEKFGIPKIDESTIPPRPRRQRTPPQPDPGQDQMGDLIVLANKLRNGGDEGVALRFAAALQSYVTAGLDSSASVFEAARRAGILLMLINQFAGSGVDVDVAKPSIDELFRLLGNQKLMENPAAWIYVVRSALNLVKHPDAKIAQVVRQKFESTADPRIHAYFTVDKEFGLVSKYNPAGLAGPADFVR